MAKITLKDPGANFRSTQQIKENNDLIEAAFENTLSRDGTSPNQMEANLDMNSNRVLNLPEPISDAEPYRKIDIDSGIGPDITVVANNIADVSTVADDIANVNTVAADLSGSDTIGAAASLIAAGSPGFISVSSAGTANVRTITGGTGVSVDDGDGASGNPVINLDAELADIAGIAPDAGVFIVGDGSGFVGESGATARDSLGLTIGQDVQAYSSNLTDYLSQFTLPTATPSVGSFLRHESDGSTTLVDIGDLGGGDMLRSNNLSDLTNINTARNNIGLVPHLAEGANAAANDTALDSLVTAGNDFALLPNRYDLSDAAVVEETGLSITGPSWTRLGFDVDGRQAHFVQTADDKHIFDVRRANFTLAHVHLENEASSYAPLIKYERNAGLGDVDARLIDVLIDGAATTSTLPVVQMNGRGLEAIMCTIANMGAHTAFAIDWENVTETFNATTDPTKGDEAGMRAYTIVLNRLHTGAGRLVSNTGSNRANISSLLVANNVLDVGGELFQGVLRQSGVFGNIANWTSGDSPFELWGGTRAAAIVGQSISGSRDVESDRPYHFAQLINGNFDGVAIVGAASEYIERDFIQVGDGVNSQTLDGLVLDGFTAFQIGAGSSAQSRYLIDFDATTANLPPVIGNGAYTQHTNNNATSVFNFTGTNNVDYLQVGALAFDTDNLDIVPSGSGVTVIYSGNKKEGLHRLAGGDMLLLAGDNVALRANPSNGHVLIGNGDRVAHRALEVSDTGGIVAAISRESSGAAGLEWRRWNSASSLATAVWQYGNFSDNTAGSEVGEIQWWLNNSGTMGLSAALTPTTLAVGVPVANINNTFALHLGKAALISQTSSLGLVLERSGSTGGIGMQFKNNTSDWNLFGLVTGANAGALVPEGTIDLGSDANPWEDVHFDGNLIRNGVTVLSGQMSTVSDPTGGTTTDAEARTAINAIIDQLQAVNLMA